MAHGDSPPGGILFVAKHEIRYRPGCGAGAPREGLRALLVKLKDSGEWTLPALEISKDVFVPEPVPYGDVLLARLDQEFTPAIEGARWFWCDFDFRDAASLHPDASGAMRRFERERKLDDIISRTAPRGDSQPTLGDEMESRNEFVAAQAAADRVCQMFNDAAEPPLSGERLDVYKRRLANRYRQHSTAWKDIDLARIDSSILDTVVGQIYADAQVAARDPSRIPRGQLIERIERDRTGRQISRFEGDAEVCWGPFKQLLRGVISMGGGR